MDKIKEAYLKHLQGDAERGDVMRGVDFGEGYKAGAETMKAENARMKKMLREVMGFLGYCYTEVQWSNGDFIKRIRELGDDIKQALQEES